MIQKSREEFELQTQRDMECALKESCKSNYSSFAADITKQKKIVED